MLLKLPKEIIFNVLNFLTFHDRLNLVKTCQHLRNVISESHLYEELPSFKDDSKAQNAFDYFRKNPAYGSQVKRLKITEILPGFSDQLPFIFPNIRDFSSTGIMYDIKDPKLYFLLKWKDTLEVFPVGDAFLLKHNTFSRISSLTLSLPSTFCDTYEKKRGNTPIDRDTDIVSPVEEALTDFNPWDIQLLSKEAQHNLNLASTDLNFQFFDCFKNTPLLKHLKLIGCNLCIEYLEKLHAVCPQLTSLSLSSMRLYVGDIDTLPTVIKPATQVLSLKLDHFTSIFKSQNIILGYLIEKYTKLTKLVLLGTDYKFIDPHKESIRKKMEFLSNIPSTIKILKLNTDMFNDPISILQESALDLTELALYPAGVSCRSIPAAVVTHPKYIDYLKSLKSLKSLTLEWNSLMDGYSDGPISNSVLHLTLQFPFGDTCSLNDILLAYPSLKSLVVRKRALDFGKTTHIPITIKGPFRYSIYPNLKKLTIDQPCLDQKVIHFIRAVLPNLKELKLFYPFSYADPDALIDLDGYNLDIFDLTPFEQIPDGTYITLYLQVKTLNELKSYKIGMVGIYGVICIREPKKDKQIKKMARIICNDIKILKINGTDMKPFLNYN